MNVDSFIEFFGEAFFNKLNTFSTEFETVLYECDDNGTQTFACTQEKIIEVFKGIINISSDKAGTQFKDTSYFPKIETEDTNLKPKNEPEKTCQSNSVKLINSCAKKLSIGGPLIKPNSTIDKWADTVLIYVLLLVGMGFAIYFFNTSNDGKELGSSELAASIRNSTMETSVKNCQNNKNFFQIRYSEKYCRKIVGPG